MNPERKWKWKSLSHVQLCDPMDYTVHGILQARVLEWVAFPCSRGSSQPRDRIQVSRVAGGFFSSWATREGQMTPACFHFLPAPPYSQPSCLTELKFLFSHSVSHIVLSPRMLFPFLFNWWKSTNLLRKSSHLSQVSLLSAPIAFRAFPTQTFIIRHPSIRGDQTSVSVPCQMLNFEGSALCLLHHRIPRGPAKCWACGRTQSAFDKRKDGSKERENLCQRWLALLFTHIASLPRGPHSAWVRLTGWNDSWGSQVNCGQWKYPWGWAKERPWWPGTQTPRGDVAASPSPQAPLWIRQVLGSFQWSWDLSGLTALPSSLLYHHIKTGKPSGWWHWW